MDLVSALAVVIGVLGAVATWLALGTSLNLQIWAIFIAWGCFFHCGGKETGLKNSIAANVWGVVMAAIALMIVPKVGGGAVGAAIVVGITVAILIFGAKVPFLSAIPAGVYGYAATAAYNLLTGVDLADVSAVLKASLIVAISLIVGNLFGYVSEKIVGTLVKA